MCYKSAVNFRILETTSRSTWFSQNSAPPSSRIPSSICPFGTPATPPAHLRLPPLRNNRSTALSVSPKTTLHIHTPHPVFLFKRSGAADPLSQHLPCRAPIVHYTFYIVHCAPPRRVFPSQTPFFSCLPEMLPFPCLLPPTKKHAFHCFFLPRLKKKLFLPRCSAKKSGHRILLKRKRVFAYPSR